MNSDSILLGVRNRIAGILPSRLVFWLAGLARGQKLKSVYVKAIRRRIYFRPRTTDLACIEKVFLQGEYGIPFEAAADVIIDGGANIGAASVYFAHHYPKATIYALEPEPSNFAVLKKNCAELENIVLMPFALWRESEKLFFSNPNSEKWAFAVVSGQSGGEPGVDGVSMEDLIARFDILRIDILKLDIEGAELELFSENSDWLERTGIIAIELHDRFKAGCAQAFYRALGRYAYRQEIRGETTFIDKRGQRVGP